MARKVRHIHAKSNEYIKVHRKHESSGDAFIGILVIIGIILFFVFWKEILTFLVITAAIGVGGWLLYKFNKEIFKGIFYFFKGIFMFFSWIFKGIAKILKPKQQSVQEQDDITPAQIEYVPESNYGKIIQKH